MDYASQASMKAFSFEMQFDLSPVVRIRDGATGVEIPAISLFRI